MKFENAIDFAENPLGLNITLYPIQRVILKAIFGIPLDYKPQLITMWDKLRVNKLREVTEAEYIHICHEEGRCNVQNWWDIPEGGFQEAVLFQGRRSGKSALLEILSNYKLWQLLEIPNPQSFFRLIPNCPIDFTLFGIDHDAAERRVESITATINSVKAFMYSYNEVPDSIEPIFFSRMLAQSPNYFSLRTNAEMKPPCSEYPSIRVAGYPSTYRGGRGPTSFFLGFDEFSHYKGSEELYLATFPSTLSFQRGSWNMEPYRRTTSMIVAVSSPWYDNHKMFELFDMAMDLKAKSGVFAHNETTANMLPYDVSKILIAESRSNPDFDVEYGGLFYNKDKKAKSYLELKEDAKKNKKKVYVEQFRG